MGKFFGRSALIAVTIAFIASSTPEFAGAEGLLNRNSQPSNLQQQELDDAYYRGYNDAKAGKEPVDYKAGGGGNNYEVARGAGRGALGGAAMGKLSDGDAGKGAAWGAGAGAIKGAVKKRRAAQEETTWASELNSAYTNGYRKGMSEAKTATAR